MRPVSDGGPIFPSLNRCISQAQRGLTKYCEISISAVLLDWGGCLQVFVLITQGKWEKNLYLKKIAICFHPKERNSVVRAHIQTNMIQAKCGSCFLFFF